MIVNEEIKNDAMSTHTCIAKQDIRIYISIFTHMHTEIYT